MPPKSLFRPCLAVLICFSGLAIADEVGLNLMEAPEQIASYYICDLENSGEPFGAQSGVCRMDDKSFPMHVGDWRQGETAGCVVKYFLLFRLPPAEGRALKHATLRLFLGQVLHEVADKPMPPAFLFHAPEWPDEAWTSDGRNHGLQTSHFGDDATFSQNVPLCGPDSRVPGFLELDVTSMIQTDYQRSEQPVAAFRLEMADHESLDITDDLQNSYNFWGPGMLDIPERGPSLVLSFD